MIRLLVLVADIRVNPIDIISHLPVMSEEAWARVPYIFVTSKEELGHASSTKRPTSCVMTSIPPSSARETSGQAGSGRPDKAAYDAEQEKFRTDITGTTLQNRPGLV